MPCPYGVTLSMSPLGLARPSTSLGATLSMSKGRDDPERVEGSKEPGLSLSKGRLRCAVAAIAALLLAACLALAQTAPPASGVPRGRSGAPTAPEASPFKAVVLVSSYEQRDTVSILFAPAVAHDHAAEVVRRLGELGGWRPVGAEIRDERLVSTWDAATEKKPQGELVTLVEFGAAGVINHRERWINLDPFIVALKQYAPLRVALAIADDVGVAGPGDFANNKVQIECNRQPRSIVYDITIKDPDLASAGVPAHAPALPAPKQPTEQAGGVSMLASLVIALAVLAAVGLGLAALWRKGLGPWAAKDNGKASGADLKSAPPSAARTEEVGIGREDERGGRA